jgi:hypothetical protein
LNFFLNCFFLFNFIPFLNWFFFKFHPSSFYSYVKFGRYIFLKLIFLKFYLSTLNWLRIEFCIFFLCGDRGLMTWVTSMQY